MEEDAITVSLPRVVPSHTSPTSSDSLHLLFGKNFAKALEVVDGGGIVCFVGEHTGRRVYKVGAASCDQQLRVLRPAVDPFTASTA